MFRLFALLGFFIAACDPSYTAICADTEFFEGGECKPISSVCEDCQDPTPVCDVSNSTCVQCLDDNDCDSGNCQDKTCVCTENAHCTDPSASLCDSATGSCSACVNNADCAHLSATPACDDGSCVACLQNSDCGADAGKTLCWEKQCVQCTRQDESACGTKACDVLNNQCSDFDQGDASNCQPCVSDTHCADNHKCVPMNFQGEAHGNYCLKTPTCSKPFIPVNKISISSDPNGTAETLCGVKESLTSCEAVLAYTTPCTAANVTDDCAVEGARCEDFGASGFFCTYNCDGSLQCEGTCDMYCKP